MELLCGPLFSRVKMMTKVKVETALEVDEVRPGRASEVVVESSRIVDANTEIESDTEWRPTSSVRSSGAASRSSDHRVLQQRTRLVIRDVEVENFKSYYGKHRIGPFHKTFTAVIGPNGSGKSNVIDSLLFVFGRSAKKIRLEKLSELIHSSAAHPNVGYSSVTAHFVRILESEEDERHPGQRVELRGSEIAVRREVYRSGASQYFIDGKRSTQKDVERRLIDEGIDLDHNRFLILQGEVEQIALMKPRGEKEGEEGLLEYLDELIGTNQYIEKIQTLSAAVEEAQTYRLEALAKEKKLLLERQALDDAKNTAVDFVSKENQQKKTLIIMCQLRMKDTEERLVEPRKLLAEIDARVQQYENEKEQQKKEKIEAEEGFTAAKKEVLELTNIRDAVRYKKQEEEAKIQKLNSGATEHERERKKMLDHITKARNEAEKAKGQQQDAERESKVHEAHLAEAKEKVEVLQAKQNHLANTVMNELRPLRQEREELRHAFAPYEEGVASATEAVRSAKAKLSTLEEATRKSEDRLVKLGEEHRQAVERIHILQETLQKSEASAQMLDQQRQLQEALIEASRRKYAINAVIVEKKQGLREGEAADRTVDFLLSQRSLKGYYGTLRQLGRIDEAFDIAAGVASNAWGFHVVENRETATAALTLLKKENVGRASMMVVQEVDRQVRQKLEAPFHSPSPKAQRLFDLIQPKNPKFRSVFYQAVRDTLVVSTLSEAREVAFNSPGGRRYRVVTLKGELVEPFGSITGGGGAPRGAKLKAARSAVDRQGIIEELKKQQAELQSAVDEEQVIQVQLNDLMHSSANGVVCSVEQREKILHELRVLQGKENRYPQREREVEEEVNEEREKNQRKQKELLQVLHRCEVEAAEVQKKRDDAYASIAVIEQKIDDAGGAAYREVVESLKHEKERVEVEETALRSCRRQQEKYRAAHERRLGDIGQYEKKLADLDQTASEGLKAEAEQHLQHLEEVQRQLVHAEEALATAQQNAQTARQTVLITQSKVLEAEKKYDEELRYRQSEAANMAKALQQLALFDQKIEGCEETIKNNVEQYGLETLPLDHINDGAEEEEEAAQEERREKNKTGGDEEDEEDEDDDEENMDEEDEEEESRREGRERKKQKKERAALLNLQGKESGNITNDRTKNNTAKDKQDENEEIVVEKKVKGKRRHFDDEEEEEENEEDDSAKEDKENVEENDEKTSEVTRKHSEIELEPPHKKKRSEEDRKDTPKRIEKESSASSLLTKSQDGKGKAERKKGGGGKRNSMTVEKVRGMSFRLSPQALENCDYNRCRHLASALLEELERLRNEIDLRSVTLWWERDTAHRQAKALYLECKEKSDALEEELYELKEQRRGAFLSVFRTIKKKVKEVYQMLTHGGDADLELVDANDPFEGVCYVVRPPRKPWRQISYLSGGEKTLSSLALIFSLHHIKPTPVYVMDEIDAALDFRNVSIVANYVLGQATGAQFIIISLRNNMFELAHQLIGVCKVNDATSTLVLSPPEFLKRMEVLCHRLMATKKEKEEQTKKKIKYNHSTTPTSSTAVVFSLSSQKPASQAVVMTVEESLRSSAAFPHEESLGDGTVLPMGERRSGKRARSL